MVKKIKQEKESIVLLLKTQSIKNILMFCLIKKIMRHIMNRIQSKLYKIGTYEVFKKSLSCFDDKRYILDDGINSLAYFYKDVKSQ